MTQPRRPGAAPHVPRRELFSAHSPAPAQAADVPRRTSHYHAVRFYDGDHALARIVVDFLRDGFDGGHPGVVVATGATRAAILRELMERPVDVAELQRSRLLLLLDARETLATFMVDGQPDPRKFREQMCRAIELVCGSRTDRTVRIFGQMVDVLWQDGHRDAAIRLEVLWNELANTEAFSLLCGYAIGNFYKNASVEDICRQHTHVVDRDGAATAMKPASSNSIRVADAVDAADRKMASEEGAA